ncbi:hypothetical protein MMC29_004334 [Sticta canariensis]|nr:hypothetical protein [Sticta canariensis]
MVEQNHNIGQISVDRRPREAKALVMLQWIAYLVEPIMRRRGWKVNFLCEFLPQDRKLLGMNADHGNCIWLRLRNWRRVDKFEDMAEILETMLHELAHNVHGHHTRDFWNLYDELRSEYKTLIRSGYASQLFHPRAHSAGGGQLPQQQVQISARPATAATQVCASGTDYGRALARETMNNHDSWACKICTLINAANHFSCDACGADRNGGMA